jgi:hypothetical protein
MSLRLLLVGGALAAAGVVAACSDPKPQTGEPAKAPPAQGETPAIVPLPAAPERKVNLIRDGIGVAGVELGMTPAEVEAKLGAPSRTNKDGERVVFMGYGANERYGVYFDDGPRVRMLIASIEDGTWCTDYDVCLYREGDLAKLKAHHGAKMLRFVDRDGAITYRLLESKGERKVLTEYTPAEERNGVVQVAILYWTGNIDTSGFD